MLTAWLRVDLLPLQGQLCLTQKHCASRRLHSWGCLAPRAVVPSSLGGRFSIDYSESGYYDLYCTRPPVVASAFPNVDKPRMCSGAYLNYLTGVRLLLLGFSALHAGLGVCIVW